MINLGIKEGWTGGIGRAIPSLCFSPFLATRDSIILFSLSFSIALEVQQAGSKKKRMLGYHFIIENYCNLVRPNLLSSPWFPRKTRLMLLLSQFCFQKSFWLLLPYLTAEKGPRNIQIF